MDSCLRVANQGVFKQIIHFIKTTLLLAVVVFSF
uniref:Uncharacterized protein n=1 Tax=Siphoviridae sp. cttFh17 TaxID=2826491 RepID=A0A8S5NJH4_9CAUD|nr:MAG TPA: hypothetical protein [Siphoviridae sp. cttFh17]